jgi:hypothetical protein
MRRLLACSLVLSFASGLAYAGDPKIDGMIRLYEKELRACRIELAGLTKIRERGAPHVAADAELAADLEGLGKTVGIVQPYCDDVAKTLDMLKADPKAKYKALEKQIDERDNIVRAGRKASKKALEETKPLITRLVPKINKLVATGGAAPPEKKAPARFPSGRTVDLPAFAGGTWSVSGSATADIAEYKDKTLLARVTVRSFTGASCEQQSKALTKTVEKLEDLEPSEAVKAKKPAFHVRHVAGDRVIVTTCLTATVKTKPGGFLAATDAPSAAKIPLEGVMLAMLAAQVAKP